MHMADALISPLVGGTMLAATAGLTSLSIKKIQDQAENHQIPLMGVMGAFVFATQMVNFSILGTGSSGHLGGGMLLAILLGPFAGFLTMTSILLIQALFFADGGLLAYGCNVINLAFYTCLVVYPLVFKPMLSRGWSARRIWIGSMLSSVIGLQLGAFSVVMQTLLSNRTELPFSSFLMLMQPIHLGIGLIEGAVTAAIVTFIWKARPELLERDGERRHAGQLPLLPDVSNRVLPSSGGVQRRSMPLRTVLVILLLAAILIGGGLSMAASTLPDGLEWSIEKVAGDLDLSANEVLHQIVARIQSRTAFLPDYQVKSADAAQPGTSLKSASLPAEQVGTALSGLAGAALTLTLTALIGLLAIRLKRRARKAPAPGG